MIIPPVDHEYILVKDKENVTTPRQNRYAERMQIGLYQCGGELALHENNTPAIMSKY